MPVLPQSEIRPPDGAVIGWVTQLPQGPSDLPPPQFILVRFELSRSKDEDWSKVKTWAQQHKLRVTDEKDLDPTFRKNFSLLADLYPSLGFTAAPTSTPPVNLTPNMWLVYRL